METFTFAPLKQSFLRSAFLENPVAWQEFFSPEDILEYEKKFPLLFGDPKKYVQNIKKTTKRTTFAKPVCQPTIQKSFTGPAKVADIINRPIQRPPDVKRLAELAKPKRVPAPTIPTVSSLTPADSKILKAINVSSVQENRHALRRTVSEVPSLSRNNGKPVLLAKKTKTPSSHHILETRLQNIRKIYRPQHHQGPLQKVSGHLHSGGVRKQHVNRQNLKSTADSKTVLPEESVYPIRSLPVDRTRRDEILKQILTNHAKLRSKIKQKRNGSNHDLKKSQLIEMFTDTLIRNLKQKNQAQRQPKLTVPSVSSITTSATCSPVHQQEPEKQTKPPRRIQLRHLNRQTFEDDTISRLSLPTDSVASFLDSSPVHTLDMSEFGATTNLAMDQPKRLQEVKSQPEFGTTKYHVDAQSDIPRNDQLFLTNLLASHYAKAGRFVPPAPKPTKSQLQVPKVPEVTAAEPTVKLNSDPKSMMRQIAHDLIYAEVLQIINEEKQLAKKSVSIGHSSLVSVGTNTSIAENTNNIIPPPLRPDRTHVIKVADQAVQSSPEKKPADVVDGSDNKATSNSPKRTVSQGITTSFKSPSPAPSSRRILRSPPRHKKSSGSESLSVPSALKSSIKTPSNSSSAPIPSFPKAAPDFLHLLMGGSGRFLKKASLTDSLKPESPKSPYISPNSHKESNVSNNGDKPSPAAEVTDCSDLEDFVASNAAVEPIVQLTPAAKNGIDAESPQPLLSIIEKKLKDADMQFPGSISFDRSHGDQISPGPKEYDWTEMETSISSIVGSIISDGELVLKCIGGGGDDIVKSPGEISTQWPYSPQLDLNALIQDLHL